jgi:uncharacterized protein (TIGR02996 family)
MNKDEDALLAEIVANPADDVPRLVYADWLEEHAGTVECGLCRGGKGADPTGLTVCVNCSGENRVSNGNAERAAFIRVQVELANIGEVPGERTWCLEESRKFDRQQVLRRRERASFDALPNDTGLTQLVLEGYTPCPYPPEGNYSWGVVRRGFVWKVHAPLAVQFGGPCQGCDGNGGNEPDAMNTWTCGICKGEGRTPGIAPALFAVQPVTEVVLVGKEPQNYHNNPGLGTGGPLFGWFRGERHPNIPEPFNLLVELWDLVAAQPECETHGLWADFTTRDAALSALSRAAVDLGRSLAVGRWHEGKCKRCRGDGLVGWQVARGGLNTAPLIGRRPRNSPCPDCNGKGVVRVPGLAPLAVAPPTPTLGRQEAT